MAAGLEDRVVELEIRLVEIAGGVPTSGGLHPADERVQPADLVRCQARHQQRDRKFFQSRSEGRGLAQGPLAEVQDPRAAIGKLGHQAVALQQEQGVSDRPSAGLHLLGDARLHEMSPGAQTTLQYGLTQAIGNLFWQSPDGSWLWKGRQGRATTGTAHERSLPAIVETGMAPPRLARNAGAQG